MVPNLFLLVAWKQTASTVREKKSGMLLSQQGRIKWEVCAVDDERWKQVVTHSHDRGLQQGE